MLCLQLNGIAEPPLVGPHSRDMPKRKHVADLASREHDDGPDALDEFAILAEDEAGK